MDDKPKKIRVVLMSYAMDNRTAKGTAIYTRNLIENMLDDDEFKFFLVHYDAVDDPLYKKAEEIIMPKFICRSRWLRQLCFFWLYRKKRFDIIHWFQPRAYPGYWWAPADVKVVTIHGGGKFYYPRFNLSARVFHWVIRYLNKWFASLIVCSKTAQEEASHTYRIARERLLPVYNGGGEKFRPLDRLESQSVIKGEYPKITRKYILNVSRLQPHKNVNSLILAYEEMRSRHSERNELLVIVARPTEKHERTYQLARESAYAQDIIFIDFLPENLINPMYSGAEVFVFLSLSEGFGLPLVESMASGTPVITSNVSCMPEIVGNAGIFVDPMNIHTIAETMSEMLSNNSLREKYRILGLERAQIFTWKHAADETKKIYKKLFYEKQSRVL